MLIKELCKLIPMETNFGHPGIQHDLEVAEKTGLAVALQSACEDMRRRFVEDDQSLGDSSATYPLTRWYQVGESEPRLMALRTETRERLLRMIESTFAAKGWRATFHLETRRADSPPVSVSPRLRSKTGLPTVRLVMMVTRRLKLPQPWPGGLPLLDHITDITDSNWDLSALRAPDRITDRTETGADAVGTRTSYGQSYDRFDLSARILPELRRANLQRWRYWPTLRGMLSIALELGWLRPDPETPDRYLAPLH